MKKLWAPWRMSYILGIDKSSQQGCIFCTKPREDKDEENFILFRGRSNFIILNAFPYNNGHLMVVPYAHIRDFTSLSNEVTSEMMELVKESMRILKEQFKPDGFNWGANVGRVAGAGIDEHIHIHVVPRRNGDTNYMPVIGETKVICECLADTYKRLFSEFQKIKI